MSKIPQPRTYTLVSSAASIAPDLLDAGTMDRSA
jgi:hypothetical protein